ncbi:hypothetical protein BKA67DRAFT_592309 [Truncatella angustata]|uniref:Ricin B lectin domain-containing protein n=1 Tax=Truncatella angustata TaxID=152316 RepID=A0A9P8ZYE3_9PEZI|nr:uncharacterized protein BKA67DRAFT_592309 [Truncatella angustata]KAH6653960.1 hypothetical protein BKA67DRAFT_592309 [Truncatella angustata]
MHSTTPAVFATFVALSVASPILSERAVTQLDQAAFEEAQERDNAATRAFSNTQIKTSDGRCLFVDELSGDFRANLTPIQVAGCGTTDGQGWDVLTSGKHNNVAGSMLVVNTLTQACFNFDPRRAAGNQVLLFSCGGRADGGGEVTDSQLFTFNGGSGPLSFSPKNQADLCFTVKGDLLDTSTCTDGDTTQTFTFGDDSLPSTGGAAPTTATATRSATISVTQTTGITSATVSPSVTSVADGAIANPTDAVPVSRAGGTLVPSAVAESHQRDDAATRAFTSVSIRAPNGQCLFVDPTGGDFRENLIPVSLVDCAGTPNEKFDIITAGKHNNIQNTALVVSSLTNGCISHDGRRGDGDTVTIFSCGGRAAGEGETNTGQVFPYTGGSSLVLAPLDAANATCLEPGNGRFLDSGSCTNDGTQTFVIQE